MLDCKIYSGTDQCSTAAEHVKTLRLALDQLALGTSLAARVGRPQHTDVGASLASRYARSTPIARRRIDALMREAQVVGTTGMRLVADRRIRPDAATAAAAHFLGNSLDRILRQVEATLAPSAA